MGTVSYRQTNAAVFDALCDAIKLSRPEDAALHRALDTMKKHLKSSEGVTFVFDGVELRILSSSRRAEDVWHITTFWTPLGDDEEPGVGDRAPWSGLTCTCPGGGHQWCWHRTFFLTCVAGMAIKQPQHLIQAIVHNLVRPLIEHELADGDERGPDPLEGMTFAGDRLVTFED